MESGDENEKKPGDALRAIVWLLSLRYKIDMSGSLLFAQNVTNFDVFFHYKVDKVQNVRRVPQDYA